MGNKIIDNIAFAKKEVALSEVLFLHALDKSSAALSCIPNISHMLLAKTVFFCMGDVLFACNRSRSLLMQNERLYCFYLLM